MATYSAVIWQLFVLLHCTQEYAAEVMCIDHASMDSPKTLTTSLYPVMVTARQCECKILPGEVIEELNIQVLLRRSDRTNNCDRTQVAIAYHNVSNTVCPEVKDGDESGMTVSLSLTKNDRVVITLWNTYREFINARVAFSSEYPVLYEVVCTEIEGTFLWPFADQGLGFEDGIVPGIKVAVVVLFFILVVLMSSIIRLIMRLRWRKLKFQRRKERAKQQRINELRQAQALDNLGFSSGSLNHNPSSRGSLTPAIDSSYCKVSHNGSIHIYPLNSSASRSNSTFKDSDQKSLTGQGSIWPHKDGQITSSSKRGHSSSGIFLNSSSSSSQLIRSSYSGNSVELVAPMHYQAPPNMMYVPQLLYAAKSSNDVANKSSKIHSFESKPTGQQARPNRQIPLERGTMAPIHVPHPGKDSQRDCFNCPNSIENIVTNNELVAPNDGLIPQKQSKNKIRTNAVSTSGNNEFAIDSELQLSRGNTDEVCIKITRESEI